MKKPTEQSNKGGAAPSGQGQRQSRAEGGSARKLLILCIVIIAAGCATKPERSTKVRHDFARAEACPSTGERKLPCPGYRIGHIEPLCAGGPDEVSNLQWEPLDYAKRRAVAEARYCRELQQGKSPERYFDNVPAE